MQCGYCTPGWLTATAALLNQVAHPDDARIAAALAGQRLPVLQLSEDSAGGPPRGRADGGARTAGPGARRPGAGRARRPRFPRCRGTWPPRTPTSFFELLADGLVTVVAAEDGGEHGGTGPAGPDAGDAAWVHVGADGTVTAFTGKVEAGQGTRTALALLVAEELAVPLGSVRVVMGDTSLSPFDLGTFGSRSMPYAAPAVAARRRRLGPAAPRGGGAAVRPGRRRPDRRGRACWPGRTARRASATASC